MFFFDPCEIVKIDLCDLNLCRSFVDDINRHTLYQIQLTDWKISTSAVPEPCFMNYLLRDSMFWTVLQHSQELQMFRQTRETPYLHNITKTTQ